MSLVGRNMLLRLEGDYFLLPSEKTLSVKAIPSVGHSPYILCRVTNHNIETGELVLMHDLTGKYDEKNFTTSKEANSKDLAEAHISSITLETNLPKLKGKSFNSDIELEKRWAAGFVKEEKPSYSLQTDPQPPMQTSTVNEVALRANEITFEDGRATFQYYINQQRKKVTVAIENPFLKREHDAIKNYFFNALGIKRLIVTILVDIKGGQIVVAATSDHLNAINENLFETITKHFLSNEVLHNDQDSFFLDEKLKTLEVVCTSQEPKNVDWLIKQLNDIIPTKHYIHLRYLSSKHLSGRFRLPQTGKPLSFLFLVPGKSHLFLVWETYKTDEATYIWRLNSSDDSALAEELESLKATILWLRADNKLKFLKDKPENFRKIDHRYSGDDFGFKKWKEELDEILRI